MTARTYNPPWNGTEATEYFLDIIWATSNEATKNYYGCITPRDVYRNVFCDLGTEDSDLQSLESVADSNVWFCPALFWNDLDRKRTSISGTWVLWADIDTDIPMTLENLLTQVPMKPSIVVESSPGRFHVYWVLSDFLRNKELIQKYNTSISEWIQDADHSGWDAGQLLRLPFGVNAKPGRNNWKPGIVYTDATAVYNLDEIEGTLPEPSHDMWRYTSNTVDVCMPQTDVSWDDLPADLAPIHKQWLMSGAPRKQRSEAIYSVIRALDSHGVSPDNIAGYLYKSPFAQKYNHNESRITNEVSRVLSKSKDGTPPPLPKFKSQGTDDTITVSKKANTVPCLPDEFWESRESLRTLRQHAHSRCASADAVLGQVMARFVAMLDHNVKLDNGIGLAPLNMIVVSLAASGGGKGHSAAVSRDILTVPRRLRSTFEVEPFKDGLGIGTGEGIIEAFMDNVKEDGPDGKSVQIRKQARHNAFFSAEEGQQVATIMERKGATLATSLCSAWKGETMGMANASKETSRQVEDGSYNLGVVMGFQLHTVTPILELVGLGLPQRILWVSANDSSVPEEAVEPPDHVLPRLLYNPQGNITFSQTIRNELRRRVWLQVTGQVEAELIRSHEPLQLCKLAGVLALFEGRTHVDTDDWDLAKLMYETSLTVHDKAWQFYRTEQWKKQEAQAQEKISRELQMHDKKTNAEKDNTRVAKLIVKYLLEGPTTKGNVRRRLPQKDRSNFEAALSQAFRDGWVEEDGKSLRIVPENTQDIS